MFLLGEERGQKSVGQNSMWLAHPSCVVLVMACKRWHVLWEIDLCRDLQSDRNEDRLGQMTIADHNPKSLDTSRFVVLKSICHSRGPLHDDLGWEIPFTYWYSVAWQHQSGKDKLQKIPPPPHSFFLVLFMSWFFVPDNIPHVKPQTLQQQSLDLSPEMILERCQWWPAQDTDRHWLGKPTVPPQIASPNVPAISVALWPEQSAATPVCLIVSCLLKSRPAGQWETTIRQYCQQNIHKRCQFHGINNGMDKNIFKGSKKTTQEEDLLHMCQCSKYNYGPRFRPKNGSKYAFLSSPFVQVITFCFLSSVKLIDPGAPLPTHPSFWGGGGNRPTFYDVYQARPNLGLPKFELGLAHALLQPPRPKMSVCEAQQQQHPSLPSSLCFPRQYDSKITGHVLHLPTVKEFIPKEMPMRSGVRGGHNPIANISHM